MKICQWCMKRAEYYYMGRTIKDGKDAYIPIYICKDHNKEIKGKALEKRR